jgi:hypothetical protein
MSKSYQISSIFPKNNPTLECPGYFWSMLVASFVLYYNVFIVLVFSKEFSDGFRGWSQRDHDPLSSLELVGYYIAKAASS